MEERKSARLYAAALALLLLSGCNGESSGLTSPASVSEPSQTSIASVTEIAEPSGEPPFATIDTEEPRHISESSPATEQPSATVEQTADTAEMQPETADEPSTEPFSTEEPPVETVTAPIIQTTTTQTTTIATTAQTEPPKPVQEVIPDIKVPLSPGVDTISDDRAVLDYSNAAEGYISVNRKNSDKLMKLRIVCGDKTYDHDVATGITEYFPLSCGSGTYTAQLYEQTTGNKFTKVMEQQFTANIRSDTAPFIYPNKYVDFDQKSAVVKKAAELCAGRSDVIEKIAAVFIWITDNVTYDKQLAATVQSGYVPDPDSVLAKKSGICYDYASLMAAMTRSQGIPTRLVIGYASPDIYHAWNEVYTKETGWITPELLLAKSGFNLTDATFYAGYTDKQKAADYISNGGNYSALYYY